MNVLVPDHIPAAIRAEWAAIPGVNIIPLTIHTSESPLRKTARNFTARYLPFSAYQRLYPLFNPRKATAFAINNQPFTTPRPDIDVFLATWLVGARPFRQLRPLLPNLKWVHCTKTGVDHLLTPGALNNVQLSCARDLHSQRIAEYHLALVLHFAKRFHLHRDHQLHGRFEEVPARTLAGKRVLILGTGSIATATAKLLEPHGMHITGVNRTGHPAAGFASVAALADLPTLLPQTNFLILALPLTPESRGLIGANQIAALPQGATIINMSRDELIHEAPLLTALRARRLNAALEITRPGGLPANHPFNKLPNALITHYSSWSGETAEAEILGRFTDNLKLYQSNQPLLGTVNPATGY